MSKNTASPGHTTVYALIPALALCLGLLAAPVSAAESKLRTSQEIDLGRMGRIGSDERSLLRLEWKSDISRIDETSLLDDMLRRLGRMEATTRDIHQLVRAMPDADELVATPQRRSDLEPLASAANFQLKLAVGAGASLLLLVIWLLRRRPHAANAYAAEPRGEPAVAVAPTAPPPSAVVGEKRAVPPAPTFTPPPPPAEPVPDTEESTSAHGTDPQQALELAEIMLSMGLASGAAQTLTEHIRSNPKQALYHWLKLLDVYRKSGNKFQFEQSSRELQQHFNIQAENWAQLHPGELPTLESFPRIASHVESIWRQPHEAIAYLKHLLEDNRGGTRAGFPQPVAEEILLLVAILKDEAAPAA